jgi:type I restriction enzyme S subunit
MNKTPFGFEYVPEGWEVVKLGDLFTPIAIRLKDIEDGNNIPVLSMTRADGLILQSEKFDKRVASRDTSQYKVVKHGQLVYGFPIDEGVIAILHRYPVGIVSPAYQVLQPICEFDLIFMNYYLKTSTLIRIYCTFSSNVVERRRNLAVRDFVKIEIPIPSLDEQRRIAHVLTMVQTAIEQQERLIALTRELKSTLMHKLFTEGLRDEKQKETEIGLVPESWGVVAFSKGVDIKNGQVDPREKPYSQMIHVGPENIERDTGRLISLQTNEELGIKSGNYHFTPSDILYSKIRPYLNKVALPDFEGTCSADMYPVKPRRDFFSRHFLFQLLLSEMFRKQAISHQDRTGIPKINRNQLGSTLLPKPPIDEQDEIATSLGVFDSKMAVAEQKRNLLEELFRTLLHQLMTAQIRVNGAEFDFLDRLAE